MVSPALLILLQIIIFPFFSGLLLWATTKIFKLKNQKLTTALLVAYIILVVDTILNISTWFIINPVIDIIATILINITIPIIFSVWIVKKFYKLPLSITIKVWLVWLAFILVFVLIVYFGQRLFLYTPVETGEIIAGQLEIPIQ